VRNFQKVGMSLAEKILEEGIDMHRPHPSLQSDRVLLYLLDRLAFGNVGRLDTEVLSKLTPSLDLFGIKLDDQLPQREGSEFLVIAPGWGIELGAKCRCICAQVEMRITIQDERYVCICDGIGGDILWR
jgi:hypothetical protein